MFLSCPCNVVALEIGEHALAKYRAVEASYRAWQPRFDGEHNPFTTRAMLELGVAKCDPVIAWLQANPARGRQIVFARHVEVQRRISEAIDGSIWLSAKMAPKARMEAVEKFQVGRAQTLVTSPAIGGLGLTLTAARRVVFAEYDFRATEHAQAEARTDRIGQSGETSSIYLHARGTLDDASKARINRKANLASAAIDGDRAGFRIPRLPAASRALLTGSGQAQAASNSGSPRLPASRPSAAACPASRPSASEDTLAKKQGSLGGKAALMLGEQIE